MSRRAALARAAAAQGLFLSGQAPILPEDGMAPGLSTAILLSPDEPGFWPLFTASAEYGDGRPDALDRWSRRVIGRIACDLGAKAVFPFGGPPWRPFTRWATRSGRAHVSPVGLLVHDVAGLFISYRGAILLAEDLPPAPAANPCTGCAAPCLQACPVGAFSAQGYDVPACHAFLDGRDGAECMGGGCKVRRACPVGQARRPAAQSAFHMKAFHPS
jgi:epoxyqueuosine reductase